MEQKKRGRPRMTDEEKAAAKIARLQKQMETAPEPPPHPGDEPSPKKWGKGGDKQEVASELIRLARAGMKLPRVDTKNPDAIRNRFELYLGECEGRGVVPTMEGLYNWLGISHKTWGFIINRVDGYIRSDEVVNTLEEIRGIMGEITSSAADAGLINTAIAVLKLTNLYGYRDVKQVEHSNEVSVKIGGSDLKTLQERYTAKEIGVVEADYEIIAERDDPEDGS